MNIVKSLESKVLVTTSYCSADMVDGIIGRSTAYRLLKKAIKSIQTNSTQSFIDFIDAHT